jgi:hypothetical protein
MLCSCLNVVLTVTQPVVTVAVYLLYKRYPKSWLRYVNVPIFFNAAGNIPPANTSKPSSVSRTSQGSFE